MAENNPTLVAAWNTYLDGVDKVSEMYQKANDRSSELYQEYKERSESHIYHMQPQSSRELIEVNHEIENVKVSLIHMQSDILKHELKRAWIEMCIGEYGLEVVVVWHYDANAKYVCQVFNHSVHPVTCEVFHYREKVMH
jgi:hypothetical protein